MSEISSAERAALKLLKKTVKDSMQDDGIEVRDADTPVAKIRRRFDQRKTSLVIVQRGEELIGMLGPHQLPKEPRADEDERPVGSIDLAPLHALTTANDLVDGLTTMLYQGYQALPVPKKHHPDKFPGLLRPKDLAKIERVLWQNADSHLLLETGYDHNRRQHAGPSVADEEAVPDTAHPRCDLLVYVPDDRVGNFIDAATGGYGYSHVAIDLGEVHCANGSPLIVEGTTAGVRRDLLAVHGDRPYVRVSLQAHGVDPEAFAACVRASLGERYDYREIFGAKWMDARVKQICSDLVAVCLPDTLCAAIIARAQEKGLRPRSVVARRHAHHFVSANAYAEYFGAPLGVEVGAPDTAVEATATEARPAT